jgi:hypothetical protein
MPDYQEYYDFEELRRGEFPENSRIVDDQEFLDRLLAIDSDAEVLWNPRRELWSLYRVTHYGASPADDLLSWEFDIVGAPGEHVIRKMQGRMLIKPGGPQDLRRAKRAWMLEVKDRITRKRREADRQWGDFFHDFRGNLNTYVRKMRTSDASTRFQRKNLRPALREGSARVPVSKTVDPVTGTVHSEGPKKILIP